MPTGWLPLTVQAVIEFTAVMFGVLAGYRLERRWERRKSRKADRERQSELDGIMSDLDEAVEENIERARRFKTESVDVITREAPVFLTSRWDAVQERFMELNPSRGVRIRYAEFFEAVENLEKAVDVVLRQGEAAEDAPRQVERGARRVEELGREILDERR